MGRIGLMIGLLACVSPLRAQEFRNAAVDEIIASGQRPDGVVFEMMA